MDWDRKLPSLMMAYRSYKHTIEFTPLILMFGREMRFLIGIINYPTLRSTYVNQYARDLAISLEKAYHNLHA